MSTWEAFVQTQIGSGAHPATVDDRTFIERFTGGDGEYGAIRDAAAIVDRSYRGLLEVSGADRVNWLHNLTTNQVKPLQTGDGNYAFALNVKGRILFDLNILVRSSSIWVDLDRRFIDTAKPHFDKYIIMDDVTVSDRSDEFVRMGLVGPRSAQLLSALGAPQAANLPHLQTAEIVWQGSTLFFFRHDFCGPLGFELFVPASKAVDFWIALTRGVGDGRRDQADLDRRSQGIADPPATPVGNEAVHIHRIEAGIPWPLSEINDDVLPAETAQLQRAVNFNKGCYLGQEVVERMRTRNVVARQLVGLTIETDTIPPPGAELRDEDGKPVGTLTSACHSIALHTPVALAYVKTANTVEGTKLTVVFTANTLPTRVVQLPPRRGAGS